MCSISNIKVLKCLRHSISVENCVCTGRGSNYEYKYTKYSLSQYISKPIHYYFPLSGPSPGPPNIASSTSGIFHISQTASLRGLTRIGKKQRRRRLIKFSCGTNNAAFAIDILYIGYRLLMTSIPCVEVIDKEEREC